MHSSRFFKLRPEIFETFLIKAFIDGSYDVFRTTHPSKESDYA